MTAYEIAGFEGLDEQTVKDLQDVLDRIPPRWGKWLSFGKGWIPIVVQLNKDISALVPDYELYQVKEKFAGLRYYIGPFEPPVAKCCEDVRAYIAENHPFPRKKNAEDLDKHRDLVLDIWNTHNADPVFSANHADREVLLRDAKARYDEHSVEIQILIREAERNSHITCEECSAPATMYVRGYYYNTLCPECAATLGATEVSKPESDTE